MSTIATSKEILQSASRTAIGHAASDAHPCRIATVPLLAAQPHQQPSGPCPLPPSSNSPHSAS
jgi:hypothetical protein